MSSYVQSTDEMYEAVRQVVAGAIAGLVGYEPKIYWEHVGDNDTPPQDKFWLRVHRTTLDSDQGTLSNCVGQIGARRFENIGILTVELAAPVTAVKSAYLLAKCGQIIQAHLRKRVTASIVRFKGVRIDDSIGVVNRFNRLNVVAGFEYDEIQ